MTGLTLRAGQTFSPIQNDRKVQETAKYRDEDEANKHRSQHVVETTTQVAAQKTVEAHNEVQKVVKGILSQKHQKHQQQDNDSHNVSEMKKIETYKAASKKSEATEKHEI